METFTVARHGDWLLGWSDRWPGLVAGGGSERDLAEAARLALAEYRAWLESHGEQGPDGEFAVSDTVDFSEWDATGRDPCLPADLGPLEPDAAERFFRQVELSQQDLRLAANLPDELLDWIPDGVTAVRADPWAPDIRTIRGILKHALQLEVFYREGLTDGHAAGIFERIGEAESEHVSTLNRLRAAMAGDPVRVYHPIRPALGRTAQLPDEWTVRKVIRRVVSHNRAHAAEIVQRRTWVVVGRG